MVMNNIRTMIIINMISVGISFKEVVENSDPSTVFGRKFWQLCYSGNIDEMVNASVELSFFDFSSNSFVA